MDTFNGKMNPSASYTCDTLSVGGDLSVIKVRAIKKRNGKDGSETNTTRDTQAGQKQNSADEGVRSTHKKATKKVRSYYLE